MGLAGMDSLVTVAVVMMATRSMSSMETSKPVYRLRNATQWGVRVFALVVASTLVPAWTKLPSTGAIAKRATRTQL
jgi:hypothetical protein